MSGTRRRVLVFALLCVVCVAVGGGYALRAALRARSAERAAPPVAVRQAGADLLGGQARIVFRSSALGATYGKVALVPLTDPGGPRTLAGIDCERVYVAAGTGLCLAADRGAVTTYSAYLFDAGFHQLHKLPVTGLPSRARLSASGRWAATTVFVSGHSYAAGAFSTDTSVWDVASGRKVANLEEFTVHGEDGKVLRRADFNFWGVTFARDDNRFYATLGTAGRTHLVVGDLAARSVRVLRENVECPSLSPDGTRLVFKKRVEGSGPVTWRLTALDLATMAETALAETRSVDDQVEWLDDGHVLYALGDPGGTAATDTWEVPADGKGTPRLLAHGAFSPAVVHP